MSSGVKVDESVKNEYKNIKLGKTYRYMILGLSDDLKSIIVKKTAPPGTPYEEFLNDMKEVEEARECRYVIYDLPYQIRGQSNAKLVFICWSPDCATVKQKMIYAASKDALKRELGEGLAGHVQASDHEELTEAEVQKCLIKTS